MFSGKSSELFGIYRRYKLGGVPAVLIKYEGDRRYDARAEIASSHDGYKILAVSVKTLENGAVNIPDDTKIVCIDEGQFLKGLSQFCTTCNDRGINVYVAALSTDKDQKCWPFILELYPICHKIKTLYAVCVCCHNTEAIYTRSTASPADFENGNILIGKDETYVAVCAGCLKAEITTEMHQIRKERLELLKSY